MSDVGFGLGPISIGYSLAPLPSILALYGVGSSDHCCYNQNEIRQETVLLADKIDINHCQMRRVTGVGWGWVETVVRCQQDTTVVVVLGDEDQFI